MSVAPGGRLPDDNRATLILGELGALLLEAGLSVTDVRTSLETVRDSSAIDGDDLSFSVLPEMVIVTHTRTGAATVVTATTSDLFRCSWWAIVVTAVVGALVGVITTVLNRIQGAVAIVPFVATLTAATLVGALAHGAGLTQVPMFAVCAPIAIIVPGALITNALLELTARDIITGSARLLYGLIMLGFMTAGIAAGAALTGLRIDPNSAALVGEAAAANSVMGGWQALPPLWLSWVGVVILATGIGLAFGSGARLTVLNVIVMTGTYALLATLTPITGSIVATGVTAGMLLIAAQLIDRLTFAVPATVSFQPAFLLLVPGTVGLAALASSHGSTLGDATATFISLCIGTKVGAVVTETWSAIRRPR